MKRVLFLGRGLVFVGRALAFVLVVVAVVSESAKAAPYTPPSTAGCTEASAYQLSASWGDSNWYAMIPGEAPNNFAGTGWTLTGDATITTQTLADGSTGPVRLTSCRAASSAGT